MSLFLSMLAALAAIMYCKGKGTFNILQHLGRQSDATIKLKLNVSI